MSSLLVSGLAAPFLMANIAVHCLGFCEGAFCNHFFNSVVCHLHGEGDKSGLGLLRPCGLCFFCSL